MDVFSDMIRGYSDVLGVGIAGGAKGWYTIIYRSNQTSGDRMKKIAEYGPYHDKPTSGEAIAMLAFHFGMK